MQHLKNLMLTFPYEERIPDQSVVDNSSAEKYDRLVATRGEDYLLVYNYTGRVMTVDLTKIAGKTKKAWWYNPTNAEYCYIGEDKNRIVEFVSVGSGVGEDIVLVVTDSDADYMRHAMDVATIEQKSLEE